MGLRATGQVVLFDGFLQGLRRRPRRRRRRRTSDDDDNRLPQISQGEATKKRARHPEQHFTQPPPRYTEATLVKRMEELGIGRPSTYASIVSTIQEREYVRKEQNRLFPEDKGRIVTIFLLNFFRKYVGYEFTANLEEELDEISAGDLDYKQVLARFWRDFSAAIAETSELRISEVLDQARRGARAAALPAARRRHRPARLPGLRQWQPASENLAHRRLRRLFQLPRMPLHPADAAARNRAAATGCWARTSGDEISLRSGRFGPYVQRGEATEENKKPPRASLPKGWDAADAGSRQGAEAAVAAARGRPTTRRTASRSAPISAGSAPT